MHRVLLRQFGFEDGNTSYHFDNVNHHCFAGQVVLGVFAQVLKRGTPYPDSSRVTQVVVARPDMTSFDKRTSPRQIRPTPLGAHSIGSSLQQDLGSSVEQDLGSSLQQFLGRF